MDGDPGSRTQTGSDGADGGRDGDEPGYGAHTYGDAFADVYDDWYGGPGPAGDPAPAVATLAELAGGRPLLELGVGSGRLAAPLVERGIEVWGIDSSPAMLDVLRSKTDGVHAVHGDMADPKAALGGDHPPFGVIAAAFNTFFLLPTTGAQRSCLAGCAELLEPGGAVVLECYVPAEPPLRVERVLEPRRIGVDHVVLTASEHHPTEQVVFGQHIEIRESGTRLRPWRLHYLRPDQIDDVAADAGLLLDERWGGWDRCPFDDASAVHVSLYRAG